MEFITSIVDMDNIIFGTEIIPIIIRTIFFVIFFDIQFRLIHLLWPTMPKSEKHTPDKMRLWWSIKCSNVLHAVIIGPVATYAIFTSSKGSSKSARCLVAWLKADALRHIAGGSSPRPKKSSSIYTGGNCKP